MPVLELPEGWGISTPPLLSVPITVPGIPEGHSFCPWHCRCTRIADVWHIWC